MDQYTMFEDSYYQMAKGDRSTIEARTGCLFPCTYIEYRVGHTKQLPFQSSGIWVSFGSLATIVRKEVYVYPFINLVADLGGTLGLFLGFSFFAVIDIFRDIILVGGAAIK